MYCLEFKHGHHLKDKTTISIHECDKTLFTIQMIDCRDTQSGYVATQL